MKALEKDRNRRYATANGLAADLRRYLDDEPVLACPASVWYCFGKFAKRNKVALLTGALVALMFVLSSLISTWQAVRARRAEGLAQTRLAAETKARGRAAKEAAKATAISGFLQQMLGSANPENAKATDYTVRQLLDDFSAGLGDQLAGQPEVEVEVRLTMGGVYTRLIVHDQAEFHLKRAIDLARGAFGSENEKLAECLVEYAYLHIGSRRFEESEKAISEALRICRLNGTRQTLYMKALWIQQHLHVHQRRFTEAEAITQEALRVAGESPGVEFAVLANILHRYAELFCDRQEYATAEPWARRGIEMHRRVHGDVHPETGWALWALGRALEGQGKLAEAELALREAVEIFLQKYGAEYSCTKDALSQLKQNLKAQGKSAELAALSLKLVDDAKRRASGEEAEDWFRRAQLRVDREQWGAALIAYEEAVELSSESGPRTDTGLQVMEAGRAAAEAGKRDAATKLYRLAARVFTEAVAANRADPAAPVDLSGCFVRLGHHYRILAYQQWRLREYAEARDSFDASSDVFRRQLDVTNVPIDVATALEARAVNSLCIGRLWEAEARGDEALKSYQEALARYETLLTERIEHDIDPGWVNNYHGEFAQVLEQAGTPEDALRIAPKLRSNPRLDADGLFGLARCHYLIARLLQRGENTPQAESQRDEAIASYWATIDRCRAAICFKPDSAAAHNNLAWWLATCPDPKFRDPVSAVELAKKAVELDSSGAEDHFRLGFALNALGKPEEAIRSYCKALEVDPNHARCRRVLGLLLATCPDAKLRDPRLAVVHVLKAVELEPRSAEGLQVLGWVQYRAGAWRESIVALEKSCKLQEGGEGDFGQWIVLALAHARLALQADIPPDERQYHEAQSRRLYEQADRQINQSWPVRPGHEWGKLIWDFREEARELIATEQARK